MIKKTVLGLMAIGLLAVSCSSDDDNNDGPEMADLTLNLQGLEDLGNDYVYEGWIIVDGQPVTTGRFTSVDFPQTFSVDETQLENATRFVLSIEPVMDADPAPADTKILVGDFSGTTASVNTTIVGDFSNAEGSFFLRTPTDESGMNNGNDENGVWFGSPGMPPAPNFVLPTLPAGWAYEGWVVGDSGPLSTGTFTAFDSADMATPFSGPAGGPPVPGEDFFENEPAGEAFPLDVRGRTVVISVEPVPDDSPAPFAIKPLVGTAGNETAPATHAFGPNLGSLPMGSVTRN